MKIPLQSGRYAVIDAEDWWVVKQFHWYEHTSGYVFAGTVLGNGKRGIIKLHRLIAGFPPFPLDHVNRNGLDNRRINLRPCTHSQNLCNRGKQRNNTSGFKGVSQEKHTKRWRAKIWLERKQIHLGYFSDIRAAALAYENAANQYHGEFARA